MAQREQMVFLGFDLEEILQIEKLYIPGILLSNYESKTNSFFY